MLNYQRVNWTDSRGVRHAELLKGSEVHRFPEASAASRSSSLETSNIAMEHHHL